MPTAVRCLQRVRDGAFPSVVVNRHVECLASGDAVRQWKCQIGEWQGRGSVRTNRLAVVIGAHTYPDAGVYGGREAAVAAATAQRVGAIRLYHKAEAVTRVHRRRVNKKT